MANLSFKTKNSSNIQEVAYIEESKTLVVTFKNSKNPDGQPYKYDNVPPVIYKVAEGIEKANQSVGKYINENVKGFFESEKI